MTLVQFSTWAMSLQLGKSCVCYLWALVTRFHALQLHRRFRSINLKIPTWNMYVDRILKLEEHSYSCICAPLLWVWKGSGGKMRRMQSRKFTFFLHSCMGRLVKAPGWDCSSRRLSTAALEFAPLNFSFLLIRACNWHLDLSGFSPFLKF